MPAVKKSKQREVILDIMQKTKAHPTAEAVYEAVRKVIPNISLGTVYRNLSRLAEENTIIKLGIGNGKEHFDGNTDLHYHIVCLDCNSIYDIEDAPLPELNYWAAKTFKGDIHKHSVTFFGVCEACKIGKLRVKG